MKKLLNRYTILYLILLLYLVVYRGLYKFGLSDVVSAVIGCILVFFTAVVSKSTVNIHYPRSKMKIGPFFTILCLMFLAQALANPVYSLFEALFNRAGLTMYVDPEVVRLNSFPMSPTVQLLDFLFPILIGPVIEELLYRGFFAENLKESGGKVFAILVSAIAFAVGHGRFRLSVHTLFAGLVFTYTAFEYGLVWSSVFHILNNLGFGILGDVLDSVFQRTDGIPFLILSFILGFAGFFICFIKRKQITAYIKENSGAKEEYTKAFANIGFVAFFAYSLYKCIINITVI